MSLLQTAGEQAGASVHPIVVGVAGFSILIALLLVTYAFRSVGTRHK